jgi:hypothetical protein
VTKQNSDQHETVERVYRFFKLSKTGKKEALPKLKLAFKRLELKTENGVVTKPSASSLEDDSIYNMMALIVFSEMYDGSRLSRQLYRHGELGQPKRKKRSTREHPLERLAGLLNWTPRNRVFGIKEAEWSYGTWFGKNLGFMGLLELSAINRTHLVKKLFLILGLFFIKNDVEMKTNWIIWQWLKNRSIAWGLLYRAWYKTTGLYKMRNRNDFTLNT